MAAVSSERMSFNPSWMGSTYSKGVHGRQSSVEAGSPPNLSQSTVSTGDTKGVSYPLAPPKLAKNRYGREELLALFLPRDIVPPDDLKQNFPEFFIAEQQQAVCLSSHSDVEERLLHHGGINSSKAMSAISHAERLNVGPGPPPGIGSGGGGFQPPWIERGPPGPPRGGFGPPMRGGGYPYSRGRGGMEPNGPPGRFMRGRGMGPNMGDRGRGSGSGGFSFNPRAQGLYDPKDPRDRPRQRVRSVEGADGPTEHGGGSAPGRGASWSGRGRGYGQHRSEDSGGGGGMPEWMDDDDEENENDKEELGTGSFDDEGQFMRSTDERKDTSNEKDQSKESVEANNFAENPGDVAVSEPSSAKSVESTHVQHIPAQPPSRNAWFSKRENDSKPQPQPEMNVNFIGPMSRHSVDSTLLAQRQPSVPITSSFSAKEDVEDGFAKLQKDAESLVRSFSEDSSPLQSTLRHRPQLMDQKLSTTNTAQPTKALGPTVQTPLQQTHPQQTNEGEFWLYLDPKGNVQGPFDSPQMAAWFAAGYFTMKLTVKRTVDKEFCQLGDLIQHHGKVPFNADSSPGPTPTKPSQQTLYETSKSTNNIWGDEPPVTTPDPLLQTRLAAVQLQKERELREAENKRRALAEMQDQMRKEREEKERLEREMKQLEMKRLQEELERRKQMELEAQRLKELEEKRSRDEAEMRRKQLEEMVRLQDAERQRQIKEEEERRRLEEMKRHQEEEQRRRQTELQRQEEIRQQQQEAMERQRREAEQARKRLQQEQQRVIVEELYTAVQKPNAGSGSTSNGRNWTMSLTNQNDAPSHNTTAPWLTSSNSGQINMGSGAGASIVQSLVEIQREEERQLQAEKRQQHQMDAQRRQALQAMNVTSGNVWSNASKQINWEKPHEQASTPWGNASMTQNTTSHGFWDEPPSPTREPPRQHKKNENIQPTWNKTQNEAQPKNQQETAVKRLFTQTAQAKVGGPEDPFVNWVTRKVKQLNSDIDADMFCAFLKNVESPDDVEDYVIGYCGESRASKEFLQEFLRRRSEHKMKKASDDRDDLSMASAAVKQDVNLHIGGAVNEFPPQQHSRKKKKGTKSRPVDGAVLGFTATSDPNRVNAGAIDMEGV